MGIVEGMKRASVGLKNLQQGLKAQFEEQLRLLGLSEVQIESQSFQELKDSLDRVNDAISNPDGFPKFNISIGGESGLPVITQGAARAHYQVTILPILLERKKLILDRIRSLESSEKFECLQDLIHSKVTDLGTQNKLKEELNNYISESQNLKEQYQQIISAQSLQLEESEADKLRLSVEIWERRSKVLLSFLERESAATIIGSVLLVIIPIGHLVALGFGFTIPKTLDSAFLLILGYFFGQSTRRGSIINDTSKP